MKICYLASPDSIHTQRWLDYFVRAGHEVSLLNIRGHSVAQIPGVKHVLLIVLRLKRGFLFHSNNLINKNLRSVCILIKRIIKNDSNTRYDPIPLFSFCKLADHYTECIGFLLSV